MPGTAARQDFQNMLAGFAQLDRVMKQKQDDDMYNKMLDQLDPGKQHHGGKIEYDGYRQHQSDVDTHLLRQTQLNQSMHRPQYDEDGMTPFQRESLKRRDAREGRLNSGNGFSRDKRQRQGLADQFGVKNEELSPAIAAIDAYVPGQTQFPKVGIYQSGNDTPGDRKQALADAVRVYHSGMQGGTPNAGAPNAPVPPQTSRADTRPDKRARAQQALNDPQATEEERMQARRILGMP